MRGLATIVRMTTVTLTIGMRIIHTFSALVTVVSMNLNISHVAL